MKIGDTVITSRMWRARHPRCKGRGVGEIVNITPCLNGRTFSVKWLNGKYDMLAESDLVEINEDRTPDSSANF